MSVRSAPLPGRVAATTPESSSHPRTAVYRSLRDGTEVVGADLARAELMKAKTQANSVKDEWHIGPLATVTKLVSELKYDQWSKATFVNASVVVILESVLVLGWHYTESEEVGQTVLSKLHRETEAFHIVMSIAFLIGLPTFFIMDRVMFGTKPFYRASFCWTGSVLLIAFHPTAMGGICMLMPAAMSYRAWKSKEVCKDYSRRLNPLPLIDGLIDRGRNFHERFCAKPMHPEWEFAPLNSTKYDAFSTAPDHSDGEGEDIIESAYEDYLVNKNLPGGDAAYDVTVTMPGRGPPVVATKLCFAKQTDVGALPAGAEGVIYVGSDPTKAWCIRRKKVDKGHGITQDATGAVGASDGGIAAAFRKQIANDAIGKVVVFLVWMTINTLLFIEAFKRTERKIIDLDLGLHIRAAPTAKGMGAVLNFNCSLIAVPVLSQVLRYLHQAKVASVDRNGYVTYGKNIDHYFPIGKNITFHRKIAWFTMLAAAVHTVAHFINYGSAARATYVVFPHLDGVWITGVIIIVCMVVMYAAALETVRRDCFNCFWFSHHLFIVFWGCLLYHGPVFYIWSGIPLTAYFWSRYKRDQEVDCHVILQEMVLEPPDVVKITMRNEETDRRFDMWPYESGQYVRINCPFIAPLEWHPFTISSAPESGTLTCHIKVTRPGGFTGKLKKFMDALNVNGHRIFALYNSQQTSLGTTYAKVIEQPLLRIDGPHSAPCQHISEYEHSILFGAGVGLTPFSSALCSIVDHRWLRGRDPKNVYLYWSFRMSEFSMYQWFVKLLSTVRARYLGKRLTDRQFFDVNLKIFLYSTRGFKDGQKEKVISTMKQAKVYEGYSRADPVVMTVVRNDPPLGTRKKEFQLNVYEGDTVELIGSCKLEGVNSWQKVDKRPTMLNSEKFPLLQRVKVDDNESGAKFYVNGKETGSLPYSPVGYAILEDKGDFFTVENPCDTILPPQSPAYKRVAAANMPAKFDVLVPEKNVEKCRYYHQDGDGDDVSNVEILVSSGAKEQGKKRGHARVGWVNSAALELEEVEAVPLRVPPRHECFHIETGRPNYDKIFESVKEWHQHSPNEFVGASAFLLCAAAYRALASLTYACTTFVRLRRCLLLRTYGQAAPRSLQEALCSRGAHCTLRPVFATVRSAFAARAHRLLSVARSRRTLRM